MERGSVWQSYYSRRQGETAIILGTEGEGNSTVVRYQYPTSMKVRRMAMWEFLAIYHPA